MFFIVVKTRELLTKNTLENGGGAGVRKTNNNLRGQPTTETDTETDTARETDPRTETKQTPTEYRSAQDTHRLQKERQHNKCRETGRSF